MARERGDVRKLRLYVERTNEAAQATYTKLGMEASHYNMFEMDLMKP
jgi:ribosomal protein S18 acetylase RimI-like enzyme